MVMGDGSRKGNAMYIATYNFTLPEVELFVWALNKKFNGQDAQVRLHVSTYWKVYIPAASSEYLYKIIRPANFVGSTAYKVSRPYVKEVECMTYKLPAQKLYTIHSLYFLILFSFK